MERDELYQIMEWWNNEVPKNQIRRQKERWNFLLIPAGALVALVIVWGLIIVFSPAKHASILSDMKKVENLDSFIEFG